MQKWFGFGEDAETKKEKNGENSLTGQVPLIIILVVVGSGKPNTDLFVWGYISAGRALEWHSRGLRFDPAYLHQKFWIRKDSELFFFILTHSKQSA